MFRTFRTPGLAAGLIAFLLSSMVGGSEPAGTLDIYFLDMVGGGSTLIVTPAGESILIDTGSLEPQGRDAGRILQAARDAGLEKIDHLVTTHFHLDHFGAILPVAKQIEVGTFYDKGAPPPPHEQDTDWYRQLRPLYDEATGGKVTAIRAGDDLALKTAGGDVPIRIHCVASEKIVEGFDGDIDAPVEGYEMKNADKSDNARSIALLLAWGDFAFFAGGDITWNVEHHLVRPVNRIGQVDLMQLTHHGLDQSNHPLLLQAIDPTVVVAMNGPRKGIQSRTFESLQSLPNLEALYQMHYNTQVGDAGNTGADFVANREGGEAGNYIKASVDREAGVFRVGIGPDGPTKEYSIR